MSLNADTLQEVKSVLDKANEVYVLFPVQAGQDVVGAAVALASSLQQSSKSVNVASPGELNEAVQQLPLVHHVSQKIGNRNLVISLKVGSRDSIDKVSYNLEEDGSVFNLIIQPKKGQPPLKSEDVDFSYSGASADVVILVGATRFEDLGSFYADERKLFQEATTVNIHRYTASKFATYHLDDPRAGSLSEIMYQVMKGLHVSPNRDAATALLAGIDHATSNLMAPTVTADTFEAVANLLRAGGTRQAYATTSTQQEPVNRSFEPPREVPYSAPQSNPVDSSPIPASKNNAVPDEWLAPKIYKSSDSNKS